MDIKNEKLEKILQQMAYDRGHAGGEDEVKCQYKDLATEFKEIDNLLSNPIRANMFIEDGQDGSVRVKFFRSPDAADEYAEKEDIRFCEDTYSQNFIVDSGVLKPEDGWDDQ